MTCIVGIEHEGKVFLGGDSAGVTLSFNLRVRADQKVFTNGPFAFGFSDSFRLGQLLRYGLVPPPCDTWDLERYMATSFVDAVRNALKAGGYARREQEAERGGFFLVGTQGRLFRVEADYQVGWTEAGQEALGCGADLAMGALHATAALGLPPEKRITLALEAAAAFSAGVRAPFHTVSI